MGFTERLYRTEERVVNLSRSLNAWQGCPSSDSGTDHLGMLNIWCAPGNPCFRIWKTRIMLDLTPSRTAVR